MLPRNMPQIQLYEALLSFIIELAVQTARNSYIKAKEAIDDARLAARLRTLNPAPEADALLLQWRKSKTGLLEKLRFGSMLMDLEPYVDNSIVYGWSPALGRIVIVARNPGIKGWLNENCKDVVYKTAMSYKILAERARKASGLSNAVPLEWIFEDQKPLDKERGDKHPLKKILAARDKLKSLLERCRNAKELNSALDRELEISHYKLSKPRKRVSKNAKLRLEDRRARLILRTARDGLSLGKLNWLVGNLQKVRKELKNVTAG